MRSLKALISKRTINRAHVIHNVPLKKSELQDGDLCMQRDNSIGIYNSKTDFDAGGFRPVQEDDPTLIFYTPNQIPRFQHFPTKYYTDDLKDQDGEYRFDIVKVIRGLFNPKDVNDPKKVKEFLGNKSNYKNYFI